MILYKKWLCSHNSEYESKYVGYYRRPALMGIRLLWQPAVVVIVTDDDCVVVFLANKFSLSLLVTVTDLAPPLHGGLDDV